MQQVDINLRIHAWAQFLFVCVRDRNLDSKTAWRESGKTSVKHSLKCFLVIIVWICLDVRVCENLCIFMTWKGLADLLTSVIMFCIYFINKKSLEEVNKCIHEKMSWRLRFYFNLHSNGWLHTWLYLLDRNPYVLVGTIVVLKQVDPKVTPNR